VVVDADHGFGNALNVRRTIEELEGAGIAAATIEDTLLPRPYASKGRELISTEEFADKLRAGVDARGDPGFGVIARSDILSAGLEETLVRVRACVAAGVDGIFLTGKCSLEVLTAVRNLTTLPLIINDRQPPVPPAQLAALGVRIMVLGHQPYYVMLQALYDSMKSLLHGGSQRDLVPASLPPELRKLTFAEDDFAAWSAEFLKAPISIEG
jgi:carboxyvinyl-carboxyphosphonate phosphorylmutase